MFTLYVSCCNQPLFAVKCEGHVYRDKKLHQLAVAEPAKGDDLRIKDVVVGKLFVCIFMCAWLRAMLVYYM